MCHIGSFGPQLTAYGRNFKLYGYLWGEVKNPLYNLSAMTFGGMEHTQEGLRQGVELSGTMSRFSSNNNWTPGQVSLFYGGRITENIGMLAQATYNDPADQFAWDNTDIRYVNGTEISGKNLVYGITVNNNPSVQDVWQTTPAWGFPYVSSSFLQQPSASPFINGLAQQVAGVGAYGLWDDWLYAELTGYTSIASKTQQILGIAGADQNDHLSSIAPYWRVAIQHDFGHNYVEFGTFGMYADRFPGNVRSFGHDNITDYAIDGTYQYTSTDGKHAVSLYASALREHASLAATFANSGSANPSDSLSDVKANVSYYYDNTYGITLGTFNLTGDADATLYPNPINNKPGSSGWIAQADYTPFGRESSWGYPYFNVRFFAQYIAYTKFNGLSSNYDGTGRNASDNNTVFFGTWFAF